MGDKDSESKFTVREACKRTPWVLGAKFQQDKGRKEALSGYCMICIMDHDDDEFILTAYLRWGSLRNLIFIQKP